MMPNPFKEVKPFTWSQLHRKTGTFLHQMPTESDLAEGNFKETLTFCDTDMKLYVIYESDVRDD